MKMVGDIEEDDVDGGVSARCRRYRDVDEASGDDQEDDEDEDSEDLKLLLSEGG